MAKETILVIEDERDLVEVIEYNFEREGFRVLQARNGEKGLEIAREKTPEVILLDIMLPGVNGLEVAKQLRTDPQTRGIAIIMLTAKSEESDVILGLGVGADDYITKPFRIKELLARVQAVLRRTGKDDEAPAGRRFERHGLVIDSFKYVVSCAAEDVPVTLTEFKLLAALASAPGTVFARDQLLSKVRGDAYLDERNIDVHIRSIRKKLGKDCDVIQTVRGVGYKFKE
jgi:DNA-binding response OmpR family regulator